MDGRTDMTNINGDIKMAGLQMMLSVLISPSILLANLNLCHFTISLSLEALRDFKKYPRLPLPSGYDAISMADQRENSEAAEPTEREIESEKWFALSSIHPRRTHPTHRSCI